MSGMFDNPPPDALGSLLTEIRADVDVADLVSGRVRGGEPAPGDAKAAGSFQAFIVIETLADPPHPRLPVRFATFGLRCYGSTFQNASEVYLAVVKAIHRVGPRRKANGLGIYWTTAVSGGEQARDPDTQQPYVAATIELIGTTQVVPA